MSSGFGASRDKSNPALIDADSTKYTQSDRAATMSSAVTRAVFAPLPAEANDHARDDRQEE